MTIESLQQNLRDHHQSHVLRFWAELSRAGQEKLKSQLEAIDLELLTRLVADEDDQPDFAMLAAQAEPPPAVRADGTGAAWSTDDAFRIGEEALRAGEVAALIVAGGQGTRLGFDQPKGMFPIGPVSGRTLFEFFADRLSAVSKYYGIRVPLYIMTSDATDAETREYFESHRHLGLDPADVRIFQQGTMPAVDAKSGALLLAEEDSLALSPDGHGGTVSALCQSGSLDDIHARKIKHLAYIQVDNPLVALCDPTLIGHHLLSGSEMTTQVVRKRFAMERVGNVVTINGKLQIIEYSDLPSSVAESTHADGSLRLWAGNIAVHVMDTRFLSRMSRSQRALPFHRALKKVPYINAAGEYVEPSEVNAIKFERFIFDLLPEAENAFVVETLPSESFAPVKNAPGASTDTPESARQAISDLHRSWLRRAGATVTEGVQVEINPRFALYPDVLAKRIPGNLRIDADRYFVE